MRTLRHWNGPVAVVAVATMLVALSVSAAAQHTPDPYTALLDPFDGTTQGQEYGSIGYGASLPDLGQAVDLDVGDWIKYTVPGWYVWPWNYDPTGKEGTVEAWVYPEHHGVVVGQLQWYNTTTPPPAGYIGRMYITPEGLLNWYAWPAVGGPYPSDPPPTSAGVIPLDEWTHVAVTWSTAGTSLYINGVLDGYSTGNWYPALNSTFYVYLNSWGAWDLGLVDEFRISSVARSGAEILAYVDETRGTMNGPPSVDAGGPYSGSEGTAIALAGSASDPDEDPLTVSWAVDTSPTSTACVFSDPAALDPDLTCDDDGTFTVTLTADDGTAEPVSDTAVVTVANVAPTIASVTGSLDPAEVGMLTAVAVEFTDPGSGDTHDVTWTWGDSGSNTQNGATSPAAESHGYLTPGVYAVDVTVVDDDGGSDTATYEFVVVYDPDSGFVTGGGWIDSPPGAYVADPTLEGTANFGFVSKYKKGATVPDGNTEFQFKAGDLNFHSGSYDWLVIAGHDRAKYKGTGTINGGGNYGFMLTAVDNGNGGDTFRIKIWDKDDNDTLVYDNKIGSTDDGYDGTVIQAGNIKVHKK